MPVSTSNSTENGYKGLKTEKNEDFRLRFENVYAFFEIKTKSLIFPEHSIGKSMEIRLPEVILLILISIAIFRIVMFDVALDHIPIRFFESLQGWRNGMGGHGKQPELENHVGVGGYGYPAFIPLNIKNGAYALLKRDTFTDGSVKCTMTSMTASEPVVSLAVSPFSKDSRNKCGYCLRKSFGIRNMTWISTTAKMF
ncbi:hypothetical protein Tco_1439306 [Tanacetum coccineum]